jgi:hypothetical protein
VRLSTNEIIKRIIAAPLLVREFGKEHRSADALDPISFTQISLEQIQTSKQIELSFSLDVAPSSRVRHDSRIFLNTFRPAS